MLADVVLPSRRFQVYTYQVPPQLLPCLHVGCPVVVPLGSTILSGIVVSLFETQHSNTVQTRYGLKSLRSVISLEASAGPSALDQNLIKLIEKISDHYLAPLSACLRLIVPPHPIKMLKRIFITPEGQKMLSDKTLSSDTHVLLQKLHKAPRGLLRSTLSRALKNTPDLLTYGKRKGWITERTTISAGAESSEPLNSPVPQREVGHSESSHLFYLDKDTPLDSHSEKVLTPAECGHIEHRLSSAIKARKFKEIPVIGLESTRWNLLGELLRILYPQGRQALILVPEVHQAEILGERLKTDCGISVEVYHGQLSPTLRSDRWKRIQRGEVHVVVGTRLALFLPIANLGLIWIDQEEDSSYKDEHLPYYHAREVARMRGECEQTLVVYASACPSLEIVGRFRDQVHKDLERSKLHKAGVEIIDLRGLPYDTIISPALQNGINRALEADDQVILLLNRKGFSGTLLCRDCGLAPLCPDCGVPLKLYQRPSRLICYYCERNRPAHETCPTCHGTIFKFPGTGTQRLEEEVVRLFPSVSVARFDRENIKSVAEAQAMLDKFRQKKTMILIGTEFLLHWSDPPVASVLGLVQADCGLHIPDFRSSERTFHLLFKSLSLARHVQNPAHVILQTRLPEHHSIKAIGQYCPNIFYDQELELRTFLGYPPATQLVMLVVTGSPISKVQRVTDFVRQRLNAMEESETPVDEKKRFPGMPMILGPLVSRKPGRPSKKRMLFLIKTEAWQKTQRYLLGIQREYEQEFVRERVVMEINVDPLEIQ